MIGVKKCSNYSVNILSHIEKTVYFTEEMNEVRVVNETEVKLSQEKINFINDNHQKELQYWKNVALESVSTENETKELMDLAPLRACLIRKAVIKNAKKVNIDEIIFYLKFWYSTGNRDEITFTQGISSEGDVPSFEAVSESLKTFSRSMKEDENMNLKNKVLFGGWISIVAKAYRHDKIIKRKDLLH